MWSPRRLAAASALIALAMSVFAVPACEVDSSTRPHGSRPAWPSARRLGGAFGGLGAQAGDRRRG